MKIKHPYGIQVIDVNCLCGSLRDRLNTKFGHLRAQFLVILPGRYSTNHVAHHAARTTAYRLGASQCKVIDGDYVFYAVQTYEVLRRGVVEVLKDGNVGL